MAQRYLELGGLAAEARHAINKRGAADPHARTCTGGWRATWRRAADNPAKAAGILAYHYLAGSDAQKGLAYSLLAARTARAQYANVDALYHYTRALDVLHEHPAIENAERRLYVVKKELAETHLQAGQYGESIQLFEECLGKAQDREDRADLRIGLGRVHQEKGEWHRAIEELERSLSLLGRSAPHSLVGLGLRIVAQLFIRGVHTVLPWALRPLAEERKRRFLKQLWTLMSLVKIHYFVDVKS